MSNGAPKFQFRLLDLMMVAILSAVVVAAFDGMGDGSEVGAPRHVRVGALFIASTLGGVLAFFFLHRAQDERKAWNWLRWLIIFSIQFLLGVLMFVIVDDLYH